MKINPYSSPYDSQAIASMFHDKGPGNGTRGAPTSLGHQRLAQLHALRSEYVAKQTSKGNRAPELTTYGLTTARQLNARNVKELEDADDAAFQYAIAKSLEHPQPAGRYPAAASVPPGQHVASPAPTNNEAVDENLLAFDSIRSGVINAHLTTRLQLAGCSIADNGEKDNNCAFYSIASQALPDTSHEILTAYARQLRADFLGREGCSAERGMIHLDEHRDQIVDVANQLFGTSIELVTLESNPAHFIVDPGAVARITVRLPIMQKLQTLMQRPDPAMRELIRALGEDHQADTGALVKPEDTPDVKDMFIESRRASDPENSNPVLTAVIWNQGRHFVGVTGWPGRRS